MIVDPGIRGPGQHPVHDGAVAVELHTIEQRVRWLDREVTQFAGDYDLSSLRCVLNGAEPIVARTARRFLQLLAPHGLSPTALVPAWGMSETSSGVTYGDRFAANKDDPRGVELGRPIAGVRLRIVDAQGQLVAEGVEGRLQLQGDPVTSGYFGDAGATEELAAVETPVS